MCNKYLGECLDELNTAASAERHERPVGGQDKPATSRC